MPGWAVAVLTAGFGWLVYTTATCFVPQLQAPLDAAYSAPLIRELMRNDLRLRIPVGLLVRAVSYRAAAPATAPPPAFVPGRGELVSALD